MSEYITINNFSGHVPTLSKLSEREFQIAYGSQIKGDANIIYQAIKSHVNATKETIEPIKEIEDKSEGSDETFIPKRRGKKTNN